MLDPATWQPLPRPAEQASGDATRTELNTSHQGAVRHIFKIQQEM